MERNEFKFEGLEGHYPPVIARAEIGKYFPWLSAKRLANLDSQGKGPVSVKNGRAVLYPTNTLLTWMDSRNSVRGDNREGDVVETMHKKKNKGRKSKLQEVRERRGLE